MQSPTGALVDQPPEPGRFWVRFRPRRWPALADPWTDIALTELGRSRGADGDAPLAALAPPGPLGDVVYLPPVPPARRAERDALASAHAAAGNPVVAQVLPGEPGPPAAAVVADLLRPLLAGDLDSLRALPAGAWAAWPLIAGISDGRQRWEAGLERLSAAGVRGVQAAVIELLPSQRRALAEGRDDQAFAALFHAAAPCERDFARAAAAAGLEPFFARPLPRSPAAAINRRAAEELAAISDLWARLERPPGQGQAFLRAARWAERCEHDLGALSRDGNLRLLGWLDGASRRVLDELLREGSSGLLAELRRAYLEPEAA